MSKKPSVLVLGGVGMVGRNFVTYLVENELASAIRVADKRMSFMSYFPPRHEASFAADIVEELQVDLAQDSGVKKAFARDDDGAWDLVFDFCAETGYGNDDAVYAEKTVDSAVKCASKAKETGVSRFFYMSSAIVYASQTKRPATESAAIKPWTTPAKFQHQAEEALRKIAGLPLIVLRPSLVYGSGDYAAIMPFAVCAAVYAYLRDKMKLLWDKHVCRSTVHVDDVCAAAWFLVEKGKVGEIYNLSDPNNTKQGYLCDIVAPIFNIKIGYHGKIVSNLARIRMEQIVQDANDGHLKPWLDMCKASGIRNTPLTPFMHRQMLEHNHLYVNGGAITELGYVYKHPKPTTENMTAVIEEFARQKLMPMSDIVLPKMKAKLEAEKAGAAGAGGEDEVEGGADSGLEDVTLTPALAADTMSSPLAAEAAAGTAGDGTEAGTSPGATAAGDADGAGGDSDGGREAGEGAAAAAEPDSDDPQLD